LAEFAATYPEEHAAWLCGDDSRPVPGAETAADLLARTLPALREYLGQLPPGGTGLVVGHGAALMAGLLGMVGWPQDLAGGLRYLSNCGWAVLGENEVDGPVRLMAYNQRATAGAPGLLTP
ncbi:MAG: hypothetical protein HOQ22_03595, partial [Nocardioidaceae bacterium]|nr:hypothetical protein [Nocardioidaceae bacterium]